MVLVFIGGLGMGAIWYVIFNLFIMMTTYARQATVRRSIMAQALVAVVVVIANGRTFVEIFGRQTGHITQAKNIQTIPLRAADQPVLIDAITARYVYDYRLPKGVLDWTFAAPFPNELAMQVSPRSQDVYVLGSAAVELLNQNGWVSLSVAKWNPLHIDRWSFPERPQWAYVIYAKDCLKERTPN